MAYASHHSARRTAQMNPGVVRCECGHVGDASLPPVGATGRCPLCTRELSPPAPVETRAAAPRPASAPVPTIPGPAPIAAPGRSIVRLEAHDATGRAAVGRPARHSVQPPQAAPAWLVGTEAPNHRQMGPVATSLRPSLGWMFEAAPNEVPMEPAASRGIDGTGSSRPVDEPATGQSDASRLRSLRDHARAPAAGEPVRTDQVVVLCKFCVGQVDVSGMEAGDVAVCGACLAEVMVPHVSGLKRDAIVAPAAPLGRAREAHDAFDRFHADESKIRAASGAARSASPARNGQDDDEAREKARPSLVSAASGSLAGGEPAPRPRPASTMVPATEKPVSSAADRLVRHGVNRALRAVAILAALVVTALAVGLGMTHQQRGERHTETKSIDDRVADLTTEVPPTTLETKAHNGETVVAVGLIDPRSMNADKRSFVVLLDLSTRVLVVCTGQRALDGFAMLAPLVNASAAPLHVTVTGRAAHGPGGTYFLAADRFAKHHGPLPLERLR